MKHQCIITPINFPKFATLPRLQRRVAEFQIILPVFQPECRRLFALRTENMFDVS
jgi:hypothetical protein